MPPSRRYRLVDDVAAVGGAGGALTLLGTFDWRWPVIVACLLLVVWAVRR